MTEQEPLNLQQLTDRLIISEQLIEQLSRRIESLSRRLAILEGINL